MTCVECGAFDAPTLCGFCHFTFCNDCYDGTDHLFDCSENPDAAPMTYEPSESGQSNVARNWDRGRWIGPGTREIPGDGEDWVNEQTDIIEQMLGIHRQARELTADHLPLPLRITQKRYIIRMANTAILAFMVGFAVMWVFRDRLIDALFPWIASVNGLGWIVWTLVGFIIIIGLLIIFAPSRYERERH